MIAWKTQLQPTEISTIAGLDMTKVKVYLFRARKALQGLIGDPALVA